MMNINDLSWDALQTEHLASLQDMFVHNAQEMGGEIPSLTAFSGLLEMLGDAVLTNTRVVTSPENKVLAFGLLLPQQNNRFIEITLHTAYRSQEVGLMLLDWLEAQARKQLSHLETPTVRANCSEDDLFQRDLFRERGYETFITQVRMRRDLRQPLPEIPLPAGIQIVPYAPRHDETMRHAFNAAFQGHWIGELNPEAWRARFIDTPQFAPELTWLALDGETIAGFYLSEHHAKLNRESNLTEAWMEILGVVPSWRGRRLGAALTADALHRYQANGYTYAGLDVDRENITNALLLYENLGFEKIISTIYFYKSV